jgi:Peptidase family M49
MFIRRALTAGCALTLIVGTFSASIIAQQKRIRAEDQTEIAELKKKISRYSLTVVSASTASLSRNDRLALQKIIEAAKLMDPLFLKQDWSGNLAMKKQLEKDTTALGGLRLHYFNIEKGPWSSLDNGEPFVPGAPAHKPPQANFYPIDMTKEEFNTWIATLSEADREKATGFFWVIKRDANRKLTMAPYSQEYREFLAPAAQLLREASALTSNPTLKRYLSTRAEAFLSDDYYASDVAWMDLDAPIDVTIGPYETYEDELFSFKAAFEAFVTLRDDAETAKLAKFSQYLQELENNLPIDPQYRNPKLGAASPIRVVNEVFASGDGNHGVQTAAFNLPNDERVVREKGSKRVLLKNVQEAKFQKTLVPISKVVLEPAQQRDLSFGSFFTHILAHELMHGLGPHNITVNGQETTVRKQLRDTYSALEEAKADITGLWALQYLIDKGVLDKSMENALYTTFLASMFRSVRFGTNDAHGKGIALQFNYLTDEGAIKHDESRGTYSIDLARFKEGTRKLTHDIMTVQAEGSYENAKTMLDTLGVIRPPMQKTLDSLSSVPVDIEPQFPLARSASNGKK